jgi:AraC-like DNA-binding protein
VTAIAIPESLMAMPMSQYCSSAHSEYEPDQANLYQADFATSLRLLLAGYLDEGLNIGQCSDLVGMSTRSLQRRLADNGTSFHQLLDQTRFDVAKQLLQDESINVTEISFELGYANPANFTRAFQRWAGLSPRQHRSLNCQPHS